MLAKEQIFKFLGDLRNNNSKEWMDENRKRYKQVKARWIEEVTEILRRLSKYDAHFDFISPKSTLSRINNNRRFHPNKPTYKDYFTCSLSRGTDEISILHISISPGNSFIGAGLHHPSSESIKKYYEAIDYNGSKFKEILNRKALKDLFGFLTPYKNDLKTAPKGYDIKHPHIELLRKKSITLMRNLTEEDVCAENFPSTIENAYLALMPFNNYLREALVFEK
ncbi:MAG: DUF2461 domain-containing protein [Bacteroidota bacterium]